MRYVIGIVTLKEVKCQILSQVYVMRLCQCMTRIVLILMAYCVLGFAYVYAQTDSSSDRMLEANVANKSVLQNNVLDPIAGSALVDSTVAQPLSQPSAPDKDIVIEKDLEALKKTALELNRDLLILEEELLFPSNTQVVVFLSTDVGKFFTIDSVKLKINNQIVASHLYTPYENDALVRGGVQRLYIGNLKQGQHEITAVYTGEGPDKRKYKRAATLNIEKDDDPVMLELLVQDATTNMQPTFKIKEWEL